MNNKKYIFRCQHEGCGIPCVVVMESLFNDCEPTSCVCGEGSVEFKLIKVEEL